ncbi:hypothetical protein M885DRAFT_623798 [Pelagophyceae sp. CCMP2097]|nr:hypothetical protein M885DRAFT_623798 [Pelagophyceae sp. CCMP2097]
MAVRFVSTEVLSSSDGISHGLTETKESEEIIEARRTQHLSSGKTLYDQLQDKEAKDQEAYDANTKLIFAPREALAEEDILFFEEQRQRARLANESRDRAELDSFAAARRGFNETASAKADAAAPATAAVAKRPAPVTTAQPKLKRKLRAPAPAAQAAPPPSVLSSLASYSDDSEDD